MPHVVQILLPVFDNAGRHFESEDYSWVRDELASRFGGLTAYSRAPAEGLWDGAQGVQRDDIVVFEVMVDTLDRGWWRDYRRRLEQRFRQDTIVVRAQSYEML